MAGLPVRRAPYKDFLQPALQRRFASTATVLLAVSYVVAVLLSEWNSFIWSWFPIGPAGFRALAIFACGLAILVLRIANYHVGLRTSGSGVQTFASNLTKLSTYETVFWYCASSSLFCPVFLWSTPDSANLRWVTYLSGDRARANERPIFLACYLGVCAIKQSIDHFVRDVDHLDMGIMVRRDGSGDSSESPVSLSKVLWRLPYIFLETVTESVVALLATFVVYFIVLRSLAYGWTLMFLRPFYNLPRTNMLPVHWPVDIWLLMRCLFAGTFLFFVWAAGNTAFSVFMVKEPLKNGKPLTADSKDPNGSLLSGMKSKKPSIQCFAMWELSHIAQNFEDRRKAIYADIDRKDGPMWSQVYGACMDLIRGMETRTDNYGKPPVAPPPPPVEEPKPRVSAGLRNEPILSPVTSNGPGAKAREVAKIITSGSNSNSSPLSELSPLAKKTWHQTKDHVLTKEQQEAMSPENVRGQARKLSLWLMSFDWFRALFQQSFRAELAGTVLGTPHAEPVLYIHATTALCQLAVHSLGEDQFGNVHRDVPSIIRTLTAVIRKVEALKDKFPVHWTDAGSKRDCPEVDQVLEAMRTGLSQVVTSFEPFCHDLRLTQGDLRHAKEASAPPPKPEARAEVEPAPKSKPTGATASKRGEVVESSRAATRRRPSRPEMEEVNYRSGTQRR